MARGGKSRAEEFRDVLYRRRKSAGKGLSWAEPDYFADGSGCRLGVTWAKEERGSWCLRLVEGKFDDAVLLCQSRPNAALIIRLPRDFVSCYLRNLSRGQGGEIRLNVVLRRGYFYLNVPEPVGSVDISKFLEKELLLVPQREYA